MVNKILTQEDLAPGSFTCDTDGKIVPVTPPVPTPVVSTLTKNANCTVTHGDGVGGAETFQVLSDNINTQDNPITGIYGSPVTGDCPTRTVGTCGEQLVWGDDGQLKSIDLTDITYGGGWVVEDGIDITTAMADGTIPGYDHVRRDIDYGAAQGLTFETPFDPAAVGLGCYRWVADVRVKTAWSASPATPIPPPTDGPMALRVFQLFGGGNAVGGFDRRMDYTTEPADTPNHSQMHTFDMTWENIVQGGPNVLTITVALGKQSSGDAVADAIQNFAVIMAAQVTLRLERIV